MLLIHRKNFISTKTAKTAGTSVESYYEPYCMGDGDWVSAHERDETISEAGIVGYRGTDPSGKTYYNHMPAAEIRGLVGPEIWESYFKFTIIRNPFSKLVSGWYHWHRSGVNVKETVKAVLRDPGCFMPFRYHIRDIPEFRSWLLKGGQILDQDKYLIDGEVAVDYFIRQEALTEGISHVNDVLGITDRKPDLPRFKTGIRKQEIPIREFYDNETEDLVREQYAWEIKTFGYGVPDT